MIPGCLSLMAGISDERAIFEKPARRNLTAFEAMKIKLSSIMVENQATALVFYTGVPGFKKSKDIPVGEFRWLTVISPDGYPDL